MQNPGTEIWITHQQLPPFLVYLHIPSIGTPRNSQRSPLATTSTFPAPLLLAIKCDLVIFLTYLVKSSCLNVSFLFFSSSIFSPVLSDMFHHSQIYSQLIFQITPFRHISLVKKVCVDTPKYKESVSLQLVWSKPSLASVSLWFSTSFLVATEYFNLSFFIATQYQFILMILDRIPYSNLEPQPYPPIMT